MTTLQQALVKALGSDIVSQIVEKSGDTRVITDRDLQARETIWLSLDEE